MAENFEPKRSDIDSPKIDTGDENASFEDPLVELARIVHKNKQAGTSVNSGRVGTTDYFADLDNVSEDIEAPAPQQPPRVEPSFGGLGAASASASTQGDLSTSAPAPVALLRSEPADTPPAPTSAIPVPSFEPTPRPEEVEPAPVVSAATAPIFQETRAPEAAPDIGLGPDVSLDLEQNLTAELENELIGVLRKSADERPEPVIAPAPAALDNNSFASDLRVGAAFDETSDVVPRGNFQDPKSTISDPLPASEPTVEQVRPVIAAVNPAPSTAQSAPEPVAERADIFDARDSAVQPSEPARPKLNEHDLFAALNPDKPAVELYSDTEQPETDSNSPSGIDALFADLDFPDPGERAQSTAFRPTEPGDHNVVSDTEPDIDDMRWPAAADALPRPADDDAPPPPGGYDLDAVARAMQESDPSLTGAGVLPPHPEEEIAAAETGAQKSRRGLYVVAAVVAVAVIGPVGFYFVGGGQSSVPSGPPPIISGLQDPLKVYPEPVQAQADDQSSKLIYDRVENAGAAGPETLARTESPQPAELPPAPAGSENDAELVPGAPKQVRTMLVRPDGTIISSGDAQQTAPAPSTPTAPRTVQTTPVTAEPAATETPIAPVPATPTTTTAATPNSEGIRQVSTSPVTAPEPVQQPASQESVPVVTTPVIAQTPTEEATPAAPVPSVLPRKKPAVPVQVASVPAAQTAPVQTAPAQTPPPAPAASNTPLNLTQPAPSSTQSIPSGTYIVQVTSQRSAAAASDAYSGLQRRFPGILGSRNAVIVSADLGDRGVFYRARIPTTSRSEADNLCQSLQSAGGDCFVRRQP